MHVIDDVPTVTVDAVSGEALNVLHLNVDETDDAAGNDRYALGEVVDNANPDGNAGAAGLGQVTTAIGGGGLASLFTIGGDNGADGATDAKALSFVFTQAGPLATNLEATDGGAITLELTS